MTRTMPRLPGLAIPTLLILSALLALSACAPPADLKAPCHVAGLGRIKADCRFLPMGVPA